MVSPYAACRNDRRHAPGLADRRLAARQRHVLEVADPLEPDEIGDAGTRRPRRCRRRRSRCRRTRRRSPRSSSPLSARQLAMCAWWCCTATRSTPVARQGVRGRAIVGVEVVGDHAGRRARAAARGARPCPSHARHARSSPRSPRCWLRNTSRSRTSAKTFLSSPPTARIGRPSPVAARSRAARSPARASGGRSARRSPARPSRRSARGSGGRERGRRRRSRAAEPARPRRRWRSARPAVAAGHHERHTDRLEQEVVQRRVRQHHPELTQASEPPRRPARGAAASWRCRGARSAARSS